MAKVLMLAAVIPLILGVTFAAEPRSVGRGLLDHVYLHLVYK